MRNEIWLPGYRMHTRKHKNLMHGKSMVRSNLVLNNTGVGLLSVRDSAAFALVRILVFGLVRCGIGHQGLCRRINSMIEKVDNNVWRSNSNHLIQTRQGAWPRDRGFPMV